MTMHKKAKTEKDAWKIQETYEGKPHGWVQWKGTDVCMDIHCKCGELSHIDADFVYSVKCPKCGTSYMCNGHIELIELEQEPENVKTPDTVMSNMHIGETERGGEMTTELLQKFCSIDPTRQAIHQPWTRDGFTYATDGRILVRVPAMADVPENEQAPNVDRLWPMSSTWQVTGQPVPEYPPEPFSTPCKECDGKGKWSETRGKRRVDSECTECDGTGSVVQAQPIAFGKHLLSDVYLRKLSLLPGVKWLHESTEENLPVRFTFDGGEGLLMPMRKS